MEVDPPSTLRAGSGTMQVDTLKPMNRPGFGRCGKPIRLETNLFSVTIPPKLIVSQYSISLWRLKPQPRGNSRPRHRSRDPSSSRDTNMVLTNVSAIESVDFNRSVFAQVCRKYHNIFGCLFAYDGRCIAYAPREVNRSCLGVMYKVIVGREFAPPTAQEMREGKTDEVYVKIEHTKYLKYDEVLAGKTSRLACAEYLTGMDVVLGSSSLANYVQIGRSFYSEQSCNPLGRRNITTSAWRGFYQSVRLCHLGLIVNLDESFTAFWNKGGRPLNELVRDANDRRDLSCDDIRGLRDVAKRLRGVKVRAIHTGITYRVYGFSNKGADRIMFDSEVHGRKVSITEYFASTYNIRLRQKDIPCIKTHQKRDTYLPMEVLSVLENQRVTGVLAPDQTQTIVKIASTKPDIRKNAAVRTMQRLNHTSNPVCKDFKVAVNANVIAVDARVLPVPVIQYRGGFSKPNGGQWTPQRGFASPAEMNTWAVINMTDLRPNDLMQFIADMIKAGRKGGMHIPNERPKIYNSNNRRIGEDMGAIAQEFRMDNSLCINGFPLQLLLLIKDRQDALTYNLIKRTGDIELGITTQVCLQKHCVRGARGRDNYCDNVILKINSKLGGQNSVVGNYGIDPSSKVPDVGFINSPHIILGADVTHPMAGGKAPSVAALVGSRDRQGVQFSGALRNQPGRQEVITEIGEMFKEVYEQWRANFKHSVHVSTLIMFRDGVSDGQFDEVMQVELAALRTACTQISPSCRPKITYIIVTKRHHARFFGQPPNRDRSGNVLAGTVIDKDITSRDFYDFYLNSHAGIQGTSKPSKYTVLIDENKISVDALQGYIFRLSHGFVRCNRSVSMVNSVYYAHLLAFRGRAYLGEDVSDTSSNASGETTVPPSAKINSYLKRRLYFV